MKNTILLLTLISAPLVASDGPTRTRDCPLEEAVNTGNPQKVAEVLREKGHELTEVAKKAALWVATAKDSIPIIELLMSNGTPVDQGALLDAAAAFNSTNAIHFYLTQGFSPDGADGYMTPLYEAVSSRKVYAVQTLLEGKANPNRPSPSSVDVSDIYVYSRGEQPAPAPRCPLETPLQLIADQLRGYRDLIEQKAMSPDERETRFIERWRAMKIASGEDATESEKERLIKKRRASEHVSEKSDAIIGDPQWREKNFEELTIIAQLLLKYGANPHAINYRGITPAKVYPPLLDMQAELSKEDLV